jgi:hypothetical protein
VSITYEEELTVFLNNIEIAARTYYYYLNLNDTDNKDPNYFLLMRNNVAFWKLFNQTSLVTIFIYLGKIFDTNKSSHSIEKLINRYAKQEKSKNAKLKEKISKLQNEWGSIEPIRDAVVAHDEKYRHEKKGPLPSKIKLKTIKIMINKLLFIACFLRNASLPENSYDFTLRPKSINANAKKEIKKLLAQLYNDDR